ncbi:AIPR family protein [Deinococcus aerophilus]|uniref:Abortive phage infection protein C-terminal domain-containing protein n=1 Tax=Deinococcus aerophilus TaxID=522488 RepID=A0ABQ2GMQ2_9DEIO|nr:AIPR family protein [Deinococcus aerophilus]GGM02571.1 hypothetical protein GCM10010841_08870 [Deinococcus aerophilus]
MTAIPTDSPGNLNEYTRGLLDSLERQADQDGYSIERALVQSCSESLQELSQAPELLWVDVRVAGSRTQPGLLAHAWAVDELDRLHLAGVLTRDGVPDQNLPYVFSKKEVDDVLQRMLNLASHLRDGKTLTDETHPDVAEFARQGRRILDDDSPEIVLHLITPGHYRSTLPRVSLPGLIVTPRVHDIAWFWKITRDEPSEQLDFRQLPGGGLPCLVASQDVDGEPNVLLTVMPGTLLAELYDARRDELLRRNVRIYLRQTRKVNREMALSARTDPRRFVALNNGISAVAASVSLSADGSRIETMNDLQIVNGGQTTATLHEVWSDRRQPSDLAGLSVQAKITIIPPDTDASDELAQSIALAANSQNKITASDLLSGDPHERSLQRISRERRYVSQGVETGWFYERIRGQYAGMLAAEDRDAKSYPADQVITKTYGAQLAMAWDREPYLSSLGGEKALGVYKKELKRKSGNRALPEASEQDFDHLVALAIIRREADGPIAAEGTLKPPLGFYLLAWLAEHLGDEIDLNQIARTGVLPERLLGVIQQVTPLISRVMRSEPASVPHEGERPKRSDCWKEVSKITLEGLAQNVHGRRDFTRQDWQAALVWAQGKRNKVLREKIMRARKIVQTGQSSQKREFLVSVMQEAIDGGFKIDLSKVAV